MLNLTSNQDDALLKLNVLFLPSDQQTCNSLTLSQCGQEAGT